MNMKVGYQIKTIREQDVTVFDKKLTEAINGGWGLLTTTSLGVDGQGYYFAVTAAKYEIQESVTDSVTQSITNEN
jgi:hypothetical protein